jgi:anaerobic ribonucleoside-triphosphate reductase activating protein
MKYANIKYCSTTNGTGVRTSVFVSGCRIHCKGCFNKQAWDFNYGKEFTQEVIDRVLDSIDVEYCSGLTILGGEPLDPNNLSEVNNLIDQFQKRFGKNNPEKTIWLYTGYKYDTLSEEQYKVAKKADTVVDGPFELDKVDVTLQFRGSSNQNIININGK